jgi:ISXO2-like transposase domain
LGAARRAPARRQGARRGRARPGSGRLRLSVLPDASGDALGAFVADTVAPGAIVHTPDGWSGYQGLSDAGYDHRSIEQRWRHADRRIVLPRAHRAASNLKTWLGATHRGVSPDHLPVYLDEFVFRHTPPHPTRRLPDAARPRNAARTTYHQITRRAA